MSSMRSSLCLPIITVCSRRMELSLAHIMKILVGIDKEDLLDVLETLKGAGPRGPFPDPPAYQEAYHHGYAEAFSSLLEILEPGRRSKISA